MIGSTRRLVGAKGEWTMSPISRSVAAGALAALLALAACASGSTPYQPLSSTSGIAGGYSDQKLADGRFRVTFAGNRLTSRDAVEGYLLYRAAELTLAESYDWFVIVDREMDHRVTREIRPDPHYRPWFNGAYDEWRPYWRYYDSTYGWRDWDPYHGDRFWTDEVTTEEFEATAEIRMGKGPIPPGETQAMDAREVTADIARREAALRE
jgi:hypothetical protein